MLCVWKPTGKGLKLTQALSSDSDAVVPDEARAPSKRAIDNAHKYLADAMSKQTKGPSKC